MKLSPGIIAKFGGRFTARGGRATTLEGPPARIRVVLVEFPSFRASPGGLQLDRLSGGEESPRRAANAQFILVEGL